MNFVRGRIADGRLKVGSVPVDLRPKLGDKLKSFEGKEVVFGFRPEAIALGERSGANTLPATVELTEMMGDNTNVYIQMDGVQAILKVDPHDTPAVDSELVFSIPYESVYLFVGETETVIRG